MAETKPIVLQTEALTKNFGALQVTRSVSLKLPHGCRHALIGPNGAGKTTLINLITGQLKPDSGRIILDGNDITDAPVAARVRKGLTRCLLRNVPEGLLAEIVDELAGSDLRRRASAWQIEMDLGREGVKSSGVFRSSASQAPEPLPAVAVHRSRRG